MTAEGRSSRLRGLVSRDYILVLVAALVLALLVFLADRRASDARDIRGAVSAAAQKRERLTETILSDAYVVRAPAALRSTLSAARQRAILEEGSTVSPATYQTLLEISLLDSSEIAVEGPVGRPIVQRDYDVNRYIDETNTDVRATLAEAGSRKLSDADHNDTTALQLRLLAVLPAIALFLAGLAKQIRGPARRFMMPAGWACVIVCVSVLLAIEV
jgi:hypothetical protein